ncbi:MAG: TIGR00341 family protein [Phycisphaerales bacterium JB059]
MSADSPTADRMLEIVVPASRGDELHTLLDGEGVAASWLLTENSEIAVWKAAVTSQGVEEVMDALDEAFSGDDQFRVILYALEATLPRFEAPEQNGSEKKPQRVSRAELYEDVAGSAALTRMYLAQVVLATVVAAVGLGRDNTAVVIGAMVIAPLLGPNIALALGTTLGDAGLIRRAAKTAAVGVGIAMGLSLVVGMVAPIDLESREIVSRSDVGSMDIVLALASGAAGSLAFTTGVSTALVGVMVAIALLPPTVATGVLLGAGEVELGIGALLLLGINVVCVNLAAVVTFLLQGIRPARWWEAERSKRATRRALMFWAGSLLLLGGLMVLYTVLTGERME